MVCLQPKGFRNRQLPPLLAQLLDHAESPINSGRMSYGLRRLRLHRLMVRIPKTHHSRLTGLGLKAALFYARGYQPLFALWPLRRVASSSPGLLRPGGKGPAGELVDASSPADSGPAA